MLVVHRIIDVLRGVVDRPKFIDLQGSSMERRRQTADLLEAADKFDFGHLPLEPDPEKREGHHVIPSFTEAERSFWIDGLIPLPAPACWFEFTLGRSRGGILVYGDEYRWGVERIDETIHGLLYTGITTMIDRREATNEALHVSIDGNGQLWDKLLGLENSGNKLASAELQNTRTAPMLAIYLTLMLSSRTTDVVAAPAPPWKLNRKRARLGHALLPAHRIVTIVPERFRRDRDPNDPKGAHRPPRLHWRRSHLRHFESQTPRSVWKPTAVHEGRTGWWIAVIPRFLVGRAEHGEVSHEYRVVSHSDTPEVKNGFTGPGAERSLPPGR